MVTCLSQDDPDNQWDYCPSLTPAILFAILYGITTTVHIFQASRYKTSFCWVLIMGAIWETLAFVIRAVSVENQALKWAYDLQFILILLAPLWINAFDYMLLGRMLAFWTPGQKLIGIPPRWLATVFVTLDLVSFVIQLGGGLMTISTNYNTLQNGLHIYTAGVALQEFFIIAFLLLVITFHRRLLSLSSSPLNTITSSSTTKRASSLHLLYVLYASLALISFRILFRIIEFSAGAGTALTREFRLHETYSYAFDSVPMLFALLAMNVLHPGSVLGAEGSRLRGKKTIVEGESSEGSGIQMG